MQQQFILSKHKKIANLQDDILLCNTYLYIFAQFSSSQGIHNVSLLDCDECYSVEILYMMMSNRLELQHCILLMLC